MREYEEGRVTSISRKEMERWARQFLQEYFISDFDRLKKKGYAMAAHLVEEVVESEELKSMDPARMEPALQSFLDLNPFTQFIYVTDREGIKVTRNITHIADRAKYDKARVGEDLSGRDWFIEPLKDGEVHVTDFYKSMYTGALCITVSAPIRDATDEIVGVLGLDIRFEELAKLEEDSEI
jgi:hypothetical protein